jgi:hypothetical protein
MAKNYQSNKPCIVCGVNQAGMVTYHHVYTRKAYPNNSEDEWNLMSLCSWHHVETHKIGTVSFSKKYAQVNNWLIKNGWELVMGKWIHSI